MAVKMVGFVGGPWEGKFDVDCGASDSLPEWVNKPIDADGNGCAQGDDSGSALYQLVRYGDGVRYLFRRTTPLPQKASG